MNNTFTFVLLIIAIVMSARLIETWMKQRKMRQDAEPEADEMAARIEQLEERIRVLERIVTEKPYDLKREIDRL